MTLSAEPLAGRRILLGVSGGIAAYKSADLARRLVEWGAEVQVVMTPAATGFITPLTMQAVSGRPVRTELLDPAAEAGMGHIELARWPELVLVAPASADFLARIACGLADDLLAALCLASDRPLAVAPAMNRLMWAHPATRANLALLAGRGVHVWGPGSGSQACGETGEGRMLEALELRERVREFFCPAGALAMDGLRVLVTAGPTREPLDPVRFLSNRSSGRMGFAVAAAARDAGATVTLVSGPVQLAAPAGVERVEVATAQAMFDAVMARAGQADIFIAAAAVSDYRVANPAGHKIKKDAEALQLELVRNPDILATVAALDAGRPFTVGFAAETHDVVRYARDKLSRKRLDMIAANLVGEGRGFDTESNSLHVLWEGGEAMLEQSGKDELARRLVALVGERFHARG